jgi:hypothetical protein
MKLEFVSEEINALYGVVYPKVIEGRKDVLWYWEARTSLDSRANGTLPSGYVYTEEQARMLVECLLDWTKTCAHYEL